MTLVLEHDALVSIELGVATTYLADVLSAITAQSSGLWEVVPLTSAFDAGLRVPHRVLASIAAKSFVLGSSGDTVLNTNLCLLLALAGVFSLRFLYSCSFSFNICVYHLQVICPLRYQLLLGLL